MLGGYNSARATAGDEKWGCPEDIVTSATAMRRELLRLKVVSSIPTPMPEYLEFACSPRGRVDFPPGPPVFPSNYKCPHDRPLHRVIICGQVASEKKATSISGALPGKI